MEGVVEEIEEELVEEIGFDEDGVSGVFGEGEVDIVVFGEGVGVFGDVF